MLATWPKTHWLEIGGLGTVLFCHSTPRSETEVFTRLTPEALLVPLFDRLGASVMVCGHTHMQFDRMIGGTRVVNAGSVGMPFGEPGAYWVALGPEVQLRHTPYNLGQAAERVRATSYPQASEFARDKRPTPSLGGRNAGGVWQGRIAVGGGGIPGAREWPALLALQSFRDRAPCRPGSS